MRKVLAILAVVALCGVGPALAIYSVSDSGNWPKSWPKELERFRKQAHTFVGPQAECRHYAIRFRDREEFEAAWPHLLNATSKGTPIHLVRAPNFFLSDQVKAGVVIHAPPEGQPEHPVPPKPAGNVRDLRDLWLTATTLEMVVDGTIIDLNRLPFPADRHIIDDRFKDNPNK